MIFKRLKKLEEKVKFLTSCGTSPSIHANWFNKINVKFENSSPNLDPVYENDGDSGFDLRAWLKKGDKDVKTGKDKIPYITIQPHERRLIPTGLRIELPEHTEAQVRPRSGLALKVGLSLANCVGTIDSRYRGDIGIIALNTSNEPITIKSGERIAQCVICPAFTSNSVNLIKIDNVDRNTERGEGGFGHTGTK